MMSNNVVSTTIPSGASVSASVGPLAFPQDVHLTSIVPPAAWTAANVSVDLSMDGVTWFQAGDQYGSVLSYPVTLGQVIMPVPGLSLAGWGFFRLRSASSANANVNQGAAATLQVVLKSYL